jgi:hypothetical protein
MRTPRFIHLTRDSLRQRRTLLAIAVLLGCVLLQFLGPATAMESEHYAINWDVMGGGGEPIRSDNYALDATIGQPSIGFKASASHEVCSGYWCSGGYEVYLPIVFRSS